MKNEGNNNIGNHVTAIVMGCTQQAEDASTSASDNVQPPQIREPVQQDTIDDASQDLVDEEEELDIGEML